MRIINLLKALRITICLLFLYFQHLALGRAAQSVLQPKFLVEVILAKNSILTHDDHLQHLLGLEARRVQLDLPSDDNVAKFRGVACPVDVVVHFVFPENTVVLSKSLQLQFGSSREHFGEFLHNCLDPPRLDYFYVGLVEHGRDEENL